MVRGIRGRLNALQGHAHQTMSQAQRTMTAIEQAILGLVEEIEDGMEVEGTVEIAGQELPVKGKLKIKFRE